MAESSKAKTAKNGGKRSRKRKQSRRSAAFSVLAGGGSGTGLFTLSERLILDPGWRYFAQAVTPWIATLITLVAPYLHNIGVSQVRYWGIQYFIWRTECHLRSIPDDPEHAEMRAAGQANIREMREMISELYSQGAQRVLDITSDDA